MQLLLSKVRQMKSIVFVVALTVIGLIVALSLLRLFSGPQTRWAPPDWKSMFRFLIADAML